MKIQITDEMIEAFGEKWLVSPSWARHGLESVIAIIERDYLIERDPTSGSVPVPDDVHKVWDRDDDLWERFASGEWVCIAQGLRADSEEEVRKTYGPVSW